MKFTLSINLVIQVLAMVVQYGNLATGVLPVSPNAKVTISLIVGLAQSASALVAHLHNPDGAAAANPYPAPKLELPKIKQ